MWARLPELGPNERRILLTCARLELDPQEEALVPELVAEPLDWDAIVYFARFHSVAPLLNRHLKRLPDPEQVPAGPRGRLLALAHRAAYQNRFMARENKELAGELNAAGVPVIVPHGLALVELLYGDLGLRPLIDLLYMVPRDRLETAGSMVLGRGYSPVRFRPRHATYQWLCPQRWYVKVDDSKLIVSLKAEPIGSLPRRHSFTFDRVREHARTVSITGERVLVLSPVDLVLYLCLQADTHAPFNQAALETTDPADLLLAEWSNNRLVRFTDIHEAVRRHRGELDWDRLAARARSCGIADAAHASLLLTEHLLGPTVPAEALEGLSGARPPRLRRALLGAVAQPPAGLSPQRLVASGWERMGHHRRKEFFRFLGLIEVAFPGLRALEAEKRTRSAPRLLGIAALQAATTLSRSVGTFLKDAPRMQEGVPWPQPAGRSGRADADGQTGGAWGDRRTNRAPERPRRPTPRDLDRA
jgi:hypothetical protein